MPYSTMPPPMVAPDCGYGRKWRDKNLADIFVRLCSDWEPGGQLNRHDIDRPTEWEVCNHRTSAGDYAHNWCCRCIAGYPQLLLDEKDSGQRERSVF